MTFVDTINHCLGCQSRQAIIDAQAREIADLEAQVTAAQEAAKCERQERVQTFSRLQDYGNERDRALHRAEAAEAHVAALTDTLRYWVDDAVNAHNELRAAEVRVAERTCEIEAAGKLREKYGFTGSLPEYVAYLDEQIDHLEARRKTAESRVETLAAALRETKNIANAGTPIGGIVLVSGEYILKRIIAVADRALTENTNDG